MNINTPAILTERQQTELNKAILQYLHPLCNNANQPELYTRLQQILLPGSNDSPHVLKDIIEQYLEKKWSTVLRLQKKIIDLENELANVRSIIDIDNIQEQQKNGQVAPIMGKDRVDWLPLQSLHSFQTQSIVNCVTIHPVLPLVFCGCNDGSIYVWNFASDDESNLPEKVIKAHLKNVHQLIISWDLIDYYGDGITDRIYILASCSSDLTIRLYNASTYQHLRTLRGHEHTISSIKFSIDSPEILYSVSRDTTVRSWNVIEGNCTRSFVAHSDWVRDLDISSKSQTPQLTYNTKKHVVNANAGASTITSTSMDASTNAYSITTTPSYGDFILTCSSDQSARLTHAQTSTGIALLLGHTHVIQCIKFLPWLSNSYLDTFILSNPDLFPTIPQVLLTDPIYNQLGYKYCITSSRDSTLKIWLLPPPNIIASSQTLLPSQHNSSHAWEITTLRGHISWVKSIQIHPNGKYIFSGSDDKTIKIWDLGALNVTGSVGVVRSLMGHEGFVTDIDMARMSRRKKGGHLIKEIVEQEEGNKKGGKDGENEKNGKIEKNGRISEPNGNGGFHGIDEVEKDLLKEIEVRIKCVFVSCATDNLVKVWK